MAGGPVAGVSACRSAIGRCGKPLTPLSGRADMHRPPLPTHTARRRPHSEGPHPGSFTMAQSSILGGNAAPSRPRGTGTDLLGPSDSSDTGSDVQGERAFATDTDGGAGALPAEL